MRTELDASPLRFALIGAHLAETNRLTAALQAHYAGSAHTFQRMPSPDGLSIAIAKHECYALHFLCTTPQTETANQEQGLQREQELRIRQRLKEHNLPYVPLSGPHTQQLHQAIAAVHACVNSAQQNPSSSTPWTWHCAECADAACERHIFQQLLKAS